MYNSICLSQSIRPLLITLIATAMLLLVSVSSVAAASFNEYTIPTVNSLPYGVAAGPDGALWFTEYNANKIGRYSAGVFTEYNIPTANSGPTSITVGPDNALWFTERQANKIGRITTGGTITEYSILTANSMPYAIVSDGSALWFTESASNKIAKITTGGTISEYSVSTPYSQPQGIAFGSDGALWFVEHAANRIGRMTTGGVFTTEYFIPTANSGAMEIVTGPDSALWFTESAANQIGRITTAGTVTEFVIPTANSNPIGIISGPSGALWFTENNANKIAQIATGGAVTEYVIPTANSMPIGLTALGGNVWFAESNANKIGVLVLTTPTPSKIFLPHIVKGVTPACVGAGTYDDTDSHIAYSGNWQLYSGTGPFNNTLHYSDGVGETAQLVFCGVGVTILYASGPNGGVTNVSIDGVLAGTINHYSASVQWQQQWVSGALANGTHILTLTHASGGTGSRVNLDAITVTPAPPAPGSICVSVYYDMNGNQNLDSGEPLLRGAQITLKNSSNTQVGQFVSYDTGARCFTNLPADTYTVIESINPPAFASTTTDTRIVVLPTGGSANVYFGDSVSSPNGMVSDTARGHLFITSRDTGWLLVWDEVNNRTLMTLKMGTHPQGVGLVNSRAFVAVEGSKVVTVVDAATLVVLKEINMATYWYGAPVTVAVNPNTNQVYVALYSSAGGRVAVIDAVTLSVQLIATGDGTTGVAVNPSLNQLYVTTRDSQLLQVFDTNTHVLLQQVSLGGQAYFVQAKPSTNQVYVTLAFDPPDYEIATTLRSYTATGAPPYVTLGNSAIIGNTAPGGTVWVSRANGNLYVAASRDNRVQIINPTTLAILQNIVMPESNSEPFAITENNVISPGTVYVGKRNANLILKLSNSLP